MIEHAHAVGELDNECERCELLLQELTMMMYRFIAPSFTINICQLKLLSRTPVFN